MPPIYYLNPPPNPFWDFVAGLEDHPFFTGPARGRFRHYAPPSPPPQAAPGSAPAAQPTAAVQPEMSDKARGKQPTVEDPPEVDPATIKPTPKKAEDKKDEKDLPFHGRGRFANAFEREEREAQREAEREAQREARRERRGHPCRRDRGRAGWNGPPPFMFGHPFFARPPFTPPGPPGSADEQGGPPGPHHHSHGPPPHVQGHPGRHESHRHHRRSPPPHHGSRPEFDLGGFLNRLGDKLGVDLTNAAEGLGLTTDRFTAGRTSQDVNFEPRADIFENKELYTIHLSLPGAKKSDVGVDYDGENSILRITGVVHRPDVDEQMLSELVVDGRKRETGVFEKAVRLGTKRDPANIDVAAISAKMTDGVLVVKIPKVEKIHEKREVPITADPVTEGGANYEDEYSEKPILFDAEEQASIAAEEARETQQRDEINLMDMDKSEVRHHLERETEQEEAPVDETKPLAKYEEADDKQEKARSTSHEEPLPAYSADADHEEDDWEKFSDASGEGDYIKINVD